MKSIEFMYWLQGYFEVCEVETLTKDQLVKVKNHLKMAEITDKENVLPFCTWLKGFLDSVETEVPTANQTIKIKNKLNNLFEHVIEEKPAPIQRSSGMQLNPSERSVLVKC